MSLKARLTLLTASVVLLCSVGLGGVLYAVASAIQYRAIDQALAAAVTQARVKGLLANPRPIPADVFNPIALAVVDADGATTVVRQAGFVSEPLPFPVLSPTDISAALLTVTDVGGDIDYRVFARSSGGQDRIIVAATPVASLRDDLSTLRVQMLAGVLGFTVLGSILAWTLVRRSLLPVLDMVSAAQDIAHGDLDRRVPTARAGTEMAMLGDALNLMMASVTTSLAQSHAAQERLQQFVSDASHEMRTPLTVIRAYCDILSQDAGERTPTQERALERLSSQTLRLEGLVTQLLALERAAHVDHQERTTFDLGMVMEEVFSDLAALQPGRPIRFELELAAVTADVESFRQVAGNLAQNIARYTPAGSPVTVAARTQAGQVLVVVDDAGPGIPAERRAEALQRFGRMDASRSAETGGTGLGLSIVAEIVSAHHGTFELGDSPLGGLSARIAMPAAEPEGHQ